MPSVHAPSTGVSGSLSRVDLGIRAPYVLADLSAATAMGGMRSLVLDDIVVGKGPAERPWHDLYLCHVLRASGERSRRIHQRNGFISVTLGNTAMIRRHRVSGVRLMLRSCPT